MTYQLLIAAYLSSAVFLVFAMLIHAHPAYSRRDIFTNIEGIAHVYSCIAISLAYSAVLMLK